MKKIITIILLGLIIVITSLGTMSYIQNNSPYIPEGEIISDDEFYDNLKGLSDLAELEGIGGESAGEHIRITEEGEKVETLEELLDILEDAEKKGEL